MIKTITLDKAITYIGIPIIDAIASSFPELLPSWIVAKGFYGLAMEYHQDKLNEFVEFIKDNPNRFTSEIVKQESFKDGFVYTLEEYLRQRNGDKRKIIQKIFLGFTAEESKEEFELERFYHCLNILQIHEIEVLVFIAKVRIPLWRQSLLRNPIFVGSGYQSLDEYIKEKSIMMKIDDFPNDSAPENWKNTLEELQSLNLTRKQIRNLDMRGFRWKQRTEGNIFEYDIYLTQFGLAFCEYFSQIQDTKALS